MGEGIGLALVLMVIIGGCTYNNHLERSDKIEQQKLQIEVMKLEVKK